MHPNRMLSTVAIVKVGKSCYKNIQNFPSLLRRLSVWLVQDKLLAIFMPRHVEALNHFHLGTTLDKVQVIFYVRGKATVQEEGVYFRGTSAERIIVGADTMRRLGLENGTESYQRQGGRKYSQDGCGSV